MVRFSVILSFLLVSALRGSGQNAYVQLGYQAMMDKDFKGAIRQLEKACLVDSSNANALWMLGYSYFHSDNYRKSIMAYTKVLAINPTDESAYYFRSKAKTNMAKEVQLPVNEKEKCLLGAINDLNKAIYIKPEDRYYQSRGLAYREYAFFRMKTTPKGYDRSRVASALKACIADFEKVLSSNPSRTDISSLLDIAREKLATVVGHH